MACIRFLMRTEYIRLHTIHIYMNQKIHALVTFNLHFIVRSTHPYISIFFFFYLFFRVNLKQIQINLILLSQQLQRVCMYKIQSNQFEKMFRLFMHFSVIDILSLRISFKPDHTQTYSPN